MLTGSELALDRATIERSRTREMAIMAKASLQGFKFIRLRLKNIKRRCIVGVDAIVATDVINEEMGGITDYFLEVRGGEIKFQYRPELGMYVYDMLDTDRNREFLASHMLGDFWEIIDKHVEADIAFRADKIAQKLREPKPMSDAPKQFWKEVRASEQQAIRAARGEMDGAFETEPKKEGQPLPEEEYQEEESEPASSGKNKRDGLKWGANKKTTIIETRPTGVGVIAP
jgi:hypothetical protein